MASTHDPMCFQEAVQDRKWCDAMNLELHALKDNGTWTITDLPPSRKAIGVNRFTKPNIALMVLLTDIRPGWLSKVVDRRLALIMHILLHLCPNDNSEGLVGCSCP